MADWTIPEEGVRLALECTYEISALMQAIIEHCPQEYGEDTRPLVVRGLAQRAFRLNDIAMGLLNDDAALTPAEMNRRSLEVFGWPLDRRDEAKPSAALAATQREGGGA
jgi:hypothetical protein